MKKLLLLSICAVGCHAQTDLPGPVSAIPTNAGVATGTCSWNGTQTKKVCFVAASANASDHTLTATDTGYQFDNSLTFTAPTSVGTMANYVANLFAQNIFNYSANTLSIYNDVNLIAIDTGSAQPIQFYTNNTLRGQFDANGLLVSNMAGSGTRTACVASGGSFTETSCVQAISNSSAYNNSCPAATLNTGSYTDCTALTITDTGTWLITGSAEVIVSSPTVAAVMYHKLNATVQTSFAFATLAQASAPAGLVVATTITQTWIRSLTSGDTVNLSFIQTGTGTTQVNGGTVSAVFLHP